MIADEWVAVALTDDAAVVELLFRLKQTPESFASRPAKLPPLRWGHHQPRSKPATERKERDWTSCSPTTPLSWSSGSGGASSISDGSDESSRPSDLSSGDRSKSIGAFRSSVSCSLCFLEDFLFYSFWIIDFGVVSGSSLPAVTIFPAGLYLSKYFPRALSEIVPRDNRPVFG
ncbi:hypothetical protein U1Q18_002887 [Sarracenia purpurea var. burkii]